VDQVAGICLLNKKLRRINVQAKMISLSWMKKKLYICLKDFLKTFMDENKNEFTGDLLQKIEYFCAYRERSSREVIDKLYKLKVPKEKHSQIISHLTDLNFLDDVRYMRSFIQGKIRLKRDGIQKIKAALMAKGFDVQSIESILNEFQHDVQDDINVNLQFLYDKKWNSLASKSLLFQEKRQKVIQYLLAKGYAYVDIAKCQYSQEDDEA
jgi:regulatory protein